MENTTLLQRIYVVVFSRMSVSIDVIVSMYSTQNYGEA